MLRQIASGCSFAGAAICGLLGLLVRQGTMELNILERTFVATANHFWILAIVLFLAGAVLAALRPRSGWL
jgi:hypothetical protein